MKAMMLCAALAVLSACASAAPAPITGVGAVRSESASEGGGLIGLTAQALEQRLGPPAVARREGAFALHTWRGPDCALLVTLAQEGAAWRVRDTMVRPAEASAHCLPALEMRR